MLAAIASDQPQAQRASVVAERIIERIIERYARAPIVNACLIDARDIRRRR